MNNSHITFYLENQQLSSRIHQILAPVSKWNVSISWLSALVAELDTIKIC